MLNSFEISKDVDAEYSHSYNLKDDLILNYTHEDIFNLIKDNEKTIICYGYCFDVRNPQVKVSGTLDTLLKHADNFFEDIKYLNGHYILLFNLGTSWQLVTDAVSITPVYYNSNEKIVTTKKSDDLPSLNGSLVLDLGAFKLNRIKIETNKLTDERIERIVLDLVINQYKYFMDKDLTLNFRRNKMNKAIISILHPALFENFLNMREKDATTKKVSNYLAREYKLNILSDDEVPETLYMCNTHLMNYTFYMERDTGLEKQEKQNFIEKFNFEDNQLENREKIEYNIQNYLRYRNEKKRHLMFDPFNVLAIQKRIYSFNDSKTFDPLSRIVSIMHPSIDFYDFARGETLLRKYAQLKKDHTRLFNEFKNRKQNTEFLSNAKVKGIKVTDNLDGKVLEDGISFYPAKQIISKEDVFEVCYKRRGQGMILIESYFDNPRNAHRIKVDINGERNNIDEFLEGKFINVESDVELKMIYERDYQTASWQKAGKITIREID